MKILALPRDPNPYQRLLYDEMQRAGTQVSYLCDLTSSHTINLLLLPLEMAARRLGGARLIHLHWVFGFAFPGARRFPVLRQLGYVWFLAWLRVCRMLGMHLVWTAHNVLPHAPVFADDAAARRALVGACDLVLAHSEYALQELAALGAVPRRSVVIQHGPIAPPPAVRLRAPGNTDGPRRFLFFGRVQEYKGIEELIAAFRSLPDHIEAELTVAGQCDDARLRSRLRTLAGHGDNRIALRLEYVPEPVVAPLIGSCDVVVLPLRQITTSGSAMLALSYGRPLIVPVLPGLADLPEQAVLRYEGGIPALATAIARLACAGDDTLAAMSAAALSYSVATWQDIAARTTAEMLSVLGHATEAGPHQQPLGAL